MNDWIYNKVVRKNTNVQYEYERYVIENLKKHKTQRLKHWIVLLKLKFHYQILRKNDGLYYKLSDKKENNEKEIQAHQNSAINKKVSSVSKKPIKRQNNDILPFSVKKKRLEPFFFAKNLLKYDVISFDVFDTLLFRPFHDPKDVFILIAEKVNMLDFVEIRIEAEKKAREKKLAMYGNHEITLNDIYEEIERKTGLNKEEGIKIEEEIELSLVYPNEYMKCVYDILKNQGKTIIAVSDMYLSHDTISKMLKKCGYLMDELFVSCEYLCNKRNGGLYRQVLSKYQGKEIVHIGDNKATDIDKAIEEGIHAEFYRNCKYIGDENIQISNMSELVGSVCSGLINNTLFNGMNRFNPYFEYGYIYGGLYVLGFCSWINRQAQMDGIDKILFLSRDGYIYQKVFDMLNSSVKSEYVYWSRIASVIGNMEDNRYDFIKRLVDHKAVAVNSVKIQDVLKIINVNSNDIKLEKYGLRPEMILCKENKQYFEKSLVDHFDVALKCNEEKFLQNKKMLEKVVSDCRKVAVVDVGWTGSSDLAIKNLVENKYKMNCKVYCYLAASKVKGNLSNLVYNMNDTIKTYMFSQQKNRELYNYHSKANNGTNSIYFELFSQACSPSFKGISSDGKFEFDISEVENYKVIDEIHKGIIFFASQYMAIARKYPILLNISGSDAYRPYQYISQHIEYIRKYFKNFSYARGVGGNGDMKIETIEQIMKNVNL